MTFPNPGNSSKKRKQQQDSLYKKIHQLEKEKKTLSRKAKRLQKRIKREKMFAFKLPVAPNISICEQLAKEGINPKSSKKIAKTLLYTKFLSRETVEATMFSKKKSACNIISDKLLKK